MIGKRSFRAHQKSRALRLGGPGMITRRIVEGWPGVWDVGSVDISYVFRGILS